ncbi:cysteine desulfurase [Myxococcota bacterium]|nr:cysteine desulfurase [Myxococcota bacterium]MCZ7617757.1 cysteine desulfurase [Myxococcota bacterium]
MSLPFTDVELARLRADFPILDQKVRGKPLVYLDSAASTQKPRAVIDAVARLYAEDYANVHRGVYQLGERATRAFEAGREATRRLLHAPEAREVLLLRGATEAINLVAQSWGRRHVGAGDEILITAMEHHSNIVPWQMLCEERGARLVVAPIDDDGSLLLDELARRIGPRTRLVSVAHVSNALGTVNPVQEIVELAHAQGVPVLIDGAQAVARMPVDVQALGCDFYAFSAHKLYGPSGIGALWGRAELLEAMPPWQGGGEMIETVHFEKSTYAEIPHKFEAGTPHIAGGAGLAAAIGYVEAAGVERIGAHEDVLLALATEAVREVPGLRLIGTAPHKVGVLSFVIDGIHAHDVGTILDREGVAVRAGHHCAQPVMQRFGVPATVRASFGLYNSREDVDALRRGLRTVIEVFQ